MRIGQPVGIDYALIPDLQRIPATFPAYVLLVTLRVDSLRTAGVRSQLANQEFLKEIAGSGAANADKRIFKSQPCSVAAAGWIVKVGYAAGSEAAQDT